MVDQYFSALKSDVCLLFPPHCSSVADTGGKFAAGVVDTGSNFAAGVVDTGGKFAIGVVDTGGAP
jgi:hypothetical protein